jgi:hypothetical protein
MDLTLILMLFAGFVWALVAATIKYRNTLKSLNQAERIAYQDQHRAEDCRW